MSAEATGDYFGNISGDAMGVLIQIVALHRCFIGRLRGGPDYVKEADRAGRCRRRPESF